MLIPESKIDEIRERIDLVALMGRHGVVLKKSGRSFKGCCPFHNEKSPSFHVWPENHRFKCFGCQAGGDAISFVQRLLGKTFVDTVRDLAREAGVDLEAAIDPGLKERSQIKDATDAAAEYFKNQLWDATVGAKARAYLDSRGVTEDLARQFGLGWTPAAWSGLADHLRERGMLAFGEKAGLVAPRARTDGYYDMFRGRLIIPIRSPEGRTIAFGGRLLEGDEGPKYLNSRESKLYNKSETLYGLDVAREEIRKKKSAVLCEGYFDCIGLHQAGVKNAVALCSTALTPGHLTALNRADAKELVLLLDGDDAGRKAVERLAPALLGAGASTKVAALPEGEDPDTFARKMGAPAVQHLIAAAPTLTEYLFTTLLPQGKASTFEAKMAALDRLKPIAATMPVGLIRSAFFGALSSHMGLPASELEVGLRGKPVAVPKAVPKPVVAGPAAESPARSERVPDPLEALFTACVLRDRKLLTKDVYRVADELKHSGLRSLIAHVAAGNTAEDTVYDASPILKAALTQAVLPTDDFAVEQAFVSVCRRLKVRSIEEQLRRITQETTALAQSTDLGEEARDLLAQRGQLLELKRQVLGQQGADPS